MDANAELVEAVYADLHRTWTEGVSCATFRLSDQVTFVHVVQVRQEPSPLLAVKAFGEFQAWHRRPRRRTARHSGAFFAECIRRWLQFMNLG